MEGTWRPGQASALTVLTSNSTQPLLDALGALFEAECAHHISVQCDSAKVMLQRIVDGLEGDVVVLGAEAVDALAKEKIVDRDSVRPFARSRVGVGVKAGRPHPDISTVDALRRTLLDAGSVAHTVHGASGMYVPVLLERLGIADQIKPKTVTRPGGFIGRVVVTGEAEIAIQQISELLAVPGLELVGPLPNEIQKIFLTCAAIFTGSRERAAAENLLEFFSHPSCAAVFESKGLEPPSPQPAAAVS